MSSVKLLTWNRLFNFELHITAQQVCIHPMGDQWLGLRRKFLIRDETKGTRSLYASARVCVLFNRLGPNLTKLHLKNAVADLVRGLLDKIIPKGRKGKYAIHWKKAHLGQYDMNFDMYCKSYWTRWVIGAINAYYCSSAMAFWSVNTCNNCYAWTKTYWSTNTNCCA